MVAMQDTAGQNVAEVYRYGGSRLLDSGVDRFERTGYGVSSFFGRSSFTVALQRGYDSSPTGGSGVSSSGGFVQERYQTGSEGFFIARYDGTNDSVGTFSRSFTFGGGTVFARAFRIELEDSLTHSLQTHNTFSIVLGFGASTLHEGSFAY